MQMKPSLMNTGPILLGIAAILACADSTSPGTSAVGSYRAIILVTTDNTGPTNQLMLGGALNMNLASNGTTSGHLYIAASGAQPVLDADMAGTWTQNGDTIDFTQTADTFVRDMSFTIQRISTSVWALVGDQVFAGTRINLTLAHE
jgi:hypothetical protein